MSKDEDCRAEIPSILPQEDRDAQVYKPRCQQRWGARQTEGVPALLSSENVEEFLKEFSVLNKDELALQCLFDSDFDVPRAARRLHECWRARRRAQRDQNMRITPEAFEKAVVDHGKKFHIVQQTLGKKVATRDVVSKYYLWKRTTEYRDWRLRQKNKKKVKREVARLHWGEEGESEKGTLPDYHNDRCELCSTGGKLLCCDGCARAYHFSCVSITRVPDRDWYCVYCQEAMGNVRPKLIPSDDNEHCMVCVPFPGMRTVGESASSYEGGDSQEEEGDNSSDQESSDYPSTEELTPDIDSLEVHSDHDEPEAVAVKPPSSALKDLIDSAQTQQPVAESSHLRVSHPPEQPNTEAVAVASTSVQLERPGSGRKRHRKTSAPRRIPQLN